MKLKPGIPVTQDITLSDSDISFTYVRASGPGGQNVNKVSSAVQLRFNVLHSSLLSDDVRARLIRVAKNRISEEGVLVIEAKHYRTQEQNRQEAIDRLVALLRIAAERPKERRRTRVSQTERERRLREKRQRSEIKRLRYFNED